jgi:predicted dehydrogenase
MHKEQRLLRIGVVGAGPIAQFAHLEACRRARNIELYALCDVAGDLLARMEAIHQPRVTYLDYEKMLADPEVDAVIVATSDEFHVSLAAKALEAGKHVFVEKPLGLAVEECDELAGLVAKTRRIFQVGFNYRFDPSLDFARKFVRAEVGAISILNAWYCDSVARYTMTDNLQAIPVHSAQRKKPSADPKLDKGRYFLLAHGSHLFDTARFLAGPIAAIEARRRESAGSYSWSISVQFANGCLGHLTLLIPAAGDFEHGIQLFGEHGSLQGRMHLPWYRKAGNIECFSVREGAYQRLLGADADTYKLQLEAFAETILTGVSQRGASIADGVANMRALVAVSRSCESGRWVHLDEVSGRV